MFRSLICFIINYYENNPKTDNLLQGPLVYDNLNNVSTHFDPVWRDEMYGIWKTDKRGEDKNAEPFEIPMQGLGVFSCRKESKALSISGRIVILRLNKMKRENVSINSGAFILSKTSLSNFCFTFDGIFVSEKTSLNSNESLKTFDKFEKCSPVFSRSFFSSAIFIKALA